MSRIVVHEFKHEPGFHCGSSALRLLMRHFGHEYSEPMCLGLGMAPSFSYWPTKELRPSRLFFGRNPTLEADFFRNLRIDAPVVRHEAPEETWPPVRALLDAGHPVLVQVDIAHLPYYNTETHFGGHKILVAGYDEGRHTVLLSDSEFAEAQTLDRDQFARARWEPGLPWDLQGQWWNLRGPVTPAPLEEAVPRGLTECARRMTAGEGGLFGTGAMRRMAADLPSWHDAEDWSWCARFGYQIIERRGTGGGSFRKKYADFLDEAAAYDARVARFDLGSRMRTIAEKWTTFAMLLKRESERDQAPDFREAAGVFAELADLEHAFFSDVAAPAD
ncbi:MAG: BtrH N-terminal domain-containing protein [Deltaproteobacteria bacterium]|nr:BtrH N-terminal domain-containing protein [Deltaproteobacteria bacterium]